MAAWAESSKKLERRSRNLLWSAQALIEAPCFVSQAHQNFVDAGAEIIITNSYACVPFTWVKNSLHNEALS